MILSSLLVSILFGFIIDLFFRLVKNQGDFSGYVSVGEFVSNGRGKKWLQYFIFRLIPPIIILVLLNSILLTKFILEDRLVYLIICAFVSLSFRDFFQIFKRSVFINNKLIHLLNIFLVIICAFAINYLPVELLEQISPDISGIINSFWASLFLAMIILFYYDSTSLVKKRNESDAFNRAKMNYIKSSYDVIQSQFDKTIKECCTKNNCSVPLMYSILIFENMNRPRLFRLIENFIVKIFKLRLTLGIAQVSSRLPLSDIQSITMASKILKYSASLDETALHLYPMHEKLLKNDIFLSFMKKYNSDPLYAQQICDIMEEIRNFNYGMFRNGNV